MVLKCIIFLSLVSNAICVLVPLIARTSLIEINISIFNIDYFNLNKGPFNSVTSNPLIGDSPDSPYPVDDGISNYGDLIHLQRSKRDTLVFSEVLTNDPGSDTDTNLQWSARFPGYVITQVRVLNIGRQRAFCGWISTGGTQVQVGLYVPANVCYRVLIDVYARRI